MSHNLLSQEQVRKIEVQTDSILEKFEDIHDQWELLKQIAKYEKIQLKETDLKDISGMLIKNEQGKWSIVVNQTDSKTRKLFTIAHELGHYYLHRTNHNKFIDGQLVQQWNRDEASKHQICELEANEFAGNLIMPKKRIDRLIKDINKKNINEDKISQIAGEFGVSTIALAIRLSNLGYIE